MEKRVQADCERIKASGGEPLTLRQIMDAREEHRADLIKDLPITSATHAANTIISDAYMGVKRWYLGPVAYDAEVARVNDLKRRVVQAIT